MIPEIKSFHSADIENLESYKPEKSDNFGFSLELFIGPKGEADEESFEVTVCTPKWLIFTHNMDDVLIIRHYIIVFTYDFANIKNKIQRFIGRCHGKDWNECALKLSRLGHWEFEDYIK